ncbi:nickel pincer cofactor biosynthesis protein LarC [Rhodovastum atsumiense]|uniref:LarC family nickel insertion protein n=1 Tax=Rhodovastum atsumiense TaxID=504468 RepID=A0A5M6IJ81_9PROT|nr:LarC family nickel insertion protein [Rhodovastum atsumiense]KAA5608326.1 LarC family nickel insertion protein [Rhodovastum atsumiense]
MAERLHIHLDAVGGVAGDMFVAAMLDARPDLRPLVFADLAAVMPADCGQPTLTEGTTNGIAVHRFTLAGAGGGAAAGRGGHEHGHKHDHAPAHAHAHHPDAHGPGHAHQDHHHHGAASGCDFSALVQRISAASLSPGSAGQAIAILRVLAEAESRVHRQPVEEVHFHEVGDWDSLMDVIAAGSIIAALGDVSWSVSELPRGHGLVRTRHGLLPVPAPATVEILKGIGLCWRDDGIGGERVTPTGAAILAHLLRDMACRTPGGPLVATGTGAGTREMAGMPNILRALLFAARQPPQDAQGQAEEVVVLSFDVDDMTGEEIGIAADRLRAACGVLDLSLGSRMGKKARPTSDFRLLVRPECLASVSERCFVETSTIGLRWRREQRVCLPRMAESLIIEGQSLRRKRVVRPGGQSSCKVESDDVAGFEGLVRRRRVKRLGENTGEK